MVTYVAFIAIANVCIGLMLGYVLRPARFLPVEEADENDESESDFELNSSSDTTDGEQRCSSEEFDTDMEDSAPLAEKDSGDVIQPNGSVAKTWSNFAEQLRDIRQRTSYCRASQDRRLAQQAAGQLKVFIHEWTSELQTALDQRTANEARGILVTEANMGEAEMLSAQLESSLSNIEALDWSLEFDDVLNQLESELSLLDGQLRSVARSATARNETPGE